MDRFSLFAKVVIGTGAVLLLFLGTAACVSAHYKAAAGAGILFSIIAAGVGIAAFASRPAQEPPERTPQQRYLSDHGVRRRPSGALKVISLCAVILVGLNLIGVLLRLAVSLSHHR
jgi:hypothetical protein